MSEDDLRYPAPISAVPETYVTPQVLAPELNVKESTLKWWRAQSKGPDYVKMGTLIRYKRSAINAWLAANTVTLSKAGE